MKFFYSSYALYAIFLCLAVFNTIESAAKDLDYYSGTTVNDWNLVDREADFFDNDEFDKNYSLMPEDSWIKSNGSTYNDSYCGAVHVTKFTTDDGSVGITPKDGVMYKFATNTVHKKITFSILDKEKNEDGSLTVAALVKGIWTTIGSSSTRGEENCSSYTIDLPDDADAVLLYMLDDKVSVYMGQVDITDEKNTTLPVSVFDISAQLSTKTITWKVGVEAGVDMYVIQGSNDAKIWTNVTSVNASGNEEYSAPLTDSNIKAGFCFWLALLIIPFALIKQKRKVAFGVISLFILSGTIFSCSKDKDVAAADKDNLYKYYRIEMINGNTQVGVSKVISLI